MFTHSKSMPERMTTSVGSQYTSCAKLQVKQEMLDSLKMQHASGGAAVYVNPYVSENFPVLAQTTQSGSSGGGGTAAVGLALAAIGAAGAWKEEIYAGVETAIDAVDQFVDTYSRAWDKIWD